jgi:hypothetical protein
LEELRIWFGISKATVDKVINVMVPLLAEEMKVEVQFPSPERLELLKGTIDVDPDAVGSLDLTVQQIEMPLHGEYRFFRGDKGIHFFNTLAAVDFLGLFMHVEPGFAGRFPDRSALQESLLAKRLAQFGGT